MSMTPEARKALKASIIKWERNVAQKRTEDLTFGSHNCPLCDEFNTDDMGDTGCCRGCPVYAHTGEALCDGTPYEAVIDYRFAGYREIHVTDELRRLMQAELDFLRSLDV